MTETYINYICNQNSIHLVFSKMLARLESKESCKTKLLNYSNSPTIL